MIYTRGNRLDYDGWAQAGCEGWSYDEVLTYFKRAEDNEHREDAYHGVGGPLAVSDSRSMHPLVEVMLEAARQAGHEPTPDFNGARQEGVGRFQLTQRDGLRCSAADGYLHPAAGRANLDVITDALALRVLFEGDRAGFFRTRPGLDAPDVEFHFAPSMFFDEGLTAPSDHGYCFGPVVINPTSRGRVMLRAPLPDSKPRRVLCNFLTTEEDRQSMLAGMRLALEIAEQAALKAGLGLA